MTAIDARRAVLDRIRDALADRPEPVVVARDYERSLPVEIDLLALFSERVDDYRATVRRVTAAALPGALAGALAERRARRVVIPDGISAAWLAAAECEQVADDPVLSHTELDALDGVVTSCAVAIAETGTIVLDGGPGQGRRALSLLPDLHVCVVHADQIVGTVPEAIERLNPRRPQTWISGPSATSDIELERVEGVHGPRQLVVLIVAP